MNRLRTNLSPLCVRFFVERLQSESESGNTRCGGVYDDESIHIAAVLQWRRLLCALVYMIHVSFLGARSVRELSRRGEEVATVDLWRV